ncbi:hypothetical protein BJ508DRAFT_323157 [Ascobolus immersus RN42]|uniref:Rho-GAP domain-containing protein n=1 Tax=Ascobolus immersus RN42 TaxID=1160509 RepID=A0A3N4IGL8_ASCIM|nr:hypothetical protein BJ508DRAFT_323157 [Ascobolus immersus RN42]
MAPSALRSPTAPSFTKSPSASHDILNPINSSQQSIAGPKTSNQYLTPLASPSTPLSPRKRAQFADMPDEPAKSPSATTFSKPSRSKSMRHKFRPDRSQKEDKEKLPKIQSKSPLIGAFRSAKKSPSLEPPAESNYLSAPELAPRPSTSTGTLGSGKFFSRLKNGKHHHDGNGKESKKISDLGREVWASFKKSALTPKSAGSGGASPYMPASPFRNPRKTSGGSGKTPVDVFRLGLVEAATRTRVAGDPREGEAYWIPALAFRCIQFLDKFGPKELGIYRISGSLAVVDELKAEFITCHDVDLIENPPVDIHTVSSLLKGWLRGLGERDPILSDEWRARIFELCHFDPVTNAPPTHPPREFVEALEMLPPYNYYLLKAFFSHLRKIDAASDENKMNLANLAMIFCSGLRIDRFMFTWLVQSWDMCFSGMCRTEEEEFKRIHNIESARRQGDNMSDYSLIVPPHSAPASRKPSDASSQGRIEQLRKDSNTSNGNRNLTVNHQPSNQSLHPNSQPNSKPSSTHSRPSFDNRERPHTPAARSTPSPRSSPKHQGHKIQQQPVPHIQDENGHIIPPYPLTPTSTNGSEERVVREVLDREAMERRDSEARVLEEALSRFENGDESEAERQKAIVDGYVKSALTGHGHKTKGSLTLDTDMAQKLAPCLPELEPISPLM